MVHKFKFITSTAEYDSFPRGEIIPIEFIALLTSINYRDSHFLLELQNFTDGEPDLLPYMVKMRCPSNESKKLAKMTITLLYQLLNIEAPERILDDSFQPVNLHWQTLSFVNCKCFYVSRDASYSVFLEDIRPLSASYVFHAALDERESLHGKVILKILQNLILLDHNASNQFKFARLNNYNTEFTRSVERIKALRRPARAPVASNPLFAASHLRSHIETQNEFDSQLMGNEGSFDTLGLDPIEESQSSVDSDPYEHPRKRLKSRSSEVQPDMSSAAPLGSTYKLTGRMVGMFPCGPEDKGFLRIYFIPHDWPSLEDTNLVPDVNCLELLVQFGTELYELFSEIQDRPGRFADVLMQQNISIKVVRTKWRLQDELHSSHWELQHVEKQEDMLSRIERPLTASSHPPKDPFVLFKDLALGRPGEARYVRMIGMLVSCTFEPVKYVGMIFTDFTSNSDMNQKTLLDPYLLDFDNRLESHEGFRVFFYRRDFDEFDRKLKQIYGYTLNNMFLTRGHQATEGNVTHKGIVCKLLLKVQRFDDKLNAIVRACEPITAQDSLRHEDERIHLKRFFRVALERLDSSSIQRYKEAYSHCFPPLPSSQEHLAPHQALPNMLQIDNIDAYKLQRASDIAQLNQLQRESRTLYRVEGQVLTLHHNNSDGFFEILITNDLISTDYVDPARILRIAVPAGDSQRFFFSANDRPIDQAIQELRTLVAGEELCFRILRRAIRITGFQDKIAMVMIWCPIECTSEELRSQTHHSSQYKIEPSRVKNESS